MHWIFFIYFFLNSFFLVQANADPSEPFGFTIGSEKRNDLLSRKQQDLILVFSNKEEPTEYANLLTYLYNDEAFLWVKKSGGGKAPWFMPLEEFKQDSNCPNSFDSSLLMQPITTSVFRSKKPSGKIASCFAVRSVNAIGVFQVLVSPYADTCHLVRNEFLGTESEAKYDHVYDPAPFLPLEPYEDLKRLFLKKYGGAFDKARVFIDSYHEVQKMVDGKDGMKIRVKLIPPGTILHPWIHGLGFVEYTLMNPLNTDPDEEVNLLHCRLSDAWEKRSSELDRISELRALKEARQKREEEIKDLNAM